MVLLIAGGVLAAMGLIAAVVLVAEPIGIAAVSAGTGVWVFFPLFTLIGYGLLVVGSRDAAARLPSRVVAGLLLVLSLAAAIGLFLHAVGMLSVKTGTASLWYVLVVAGVFGAVGSAAFGRRAGDA